MRACPLSRKKFYKIVKKIVEKKLKIYYITGKQKDKKTKGAKMNNIKEYIDKNLNLEDICQEITNYTNCDSQYIDDIINEIADNNTSIYYSDLIKWLQDDCYASDYIEQAVQEFGIDTQNFNFMRLIQQGQYQKNYEILYKSKYDMCLLWCLQYCLDNNIELTDEQIDELSDIVDNHTEKFDDLIEKINEIKGE